MASRAELRCCVQSFKQAMEEAKEILDRRRGVTPSTELEPLDFLNPAKGASLTVIEQEKGYIATAPKRLPEDLLRAVEPPAVLQELRLLACKPDSGIDKVGTYCLSLVLHSFGYCSIECIPYCCLRSFAHNCQMLQDFLVANCIGSAPFLGNLATSKAAVRLLLQVVGKHHLLLDCRQASLRG